MMDTLAAELARDGYVVLPSVFDGDRMSDVGRELSLALERCRDEQQVLRSRGKIYGARNLLVSFPESVELLRREPLRKLSEAVLGTPIGVVRGLFFDKPPTRSWSLPWHRDQTIAVQCNRAAGDGYRNPTSKAGVPHIEPPRHVLENMLTFRIHLDTMDDENGPLAVMPGSHLVGEEGTAQPVVLTAQVGDVLVMHPLLSHSSSMSRCGSQRHRRVIHLECSAHRELPGGFEWHRFLPL